MGCVTVAASFVGLRESRGQECHLVKARTPGVYRKSGAIGRFTVMAGQAEVCPRSRPGLLAARIRIDQAHNSIAVFAVVMALKAANTAMEL